MAVPDATSSKKASKVYISGPMTGYVDYNRNSFFSAEEQLRAQGYRVLNPAFAPKDLSYAEYLKLSMVMVEICDIVVLLPGYQFSTGSKLEVTYAQALGKDIRYPMEDMYARTHK